MSVYKEVFDQNIKRIDSLCEIYHQLRSSESNLREKDKSYKFTDLLRAATVLLHSSFEEYYRGIITEWLPTKGTREALRQVVLPYDLGKREAKYYLADLLSFHDCSVNDLFINSVKVYMSRISFNNYSEICSWASKIDLDLSSFSSQKSIDNAIQRRHLIVHEADMDSTKEKKKLKKIELSDVTMWRDAYYDLVSIIDKQVDLWNIHNQEV